MFIDFFSRHSTSFRYETVNTPYGINFKVNIGLMVLSELGARKNRYGVRFDDRILLIPRPTTDPNVYLDSNLRGLKWARGL